MYIINGILFGIIFGLLFCKLFNIKLDNHGFGEFHINIPMGYYVIFIFSVIGATFGFGFTLHDLFNKI